MRIQSLFLLYAFSKDYGSYAGGGSSRPRHLLPVVGAGEFEGLGELNISPPHCLLGKGETSCGAAEELRSGGGSCASRGLYWLCKCAAGGGLKCITMSPSSSSPGAVGMAAPFP